MKQKNYWGRNEEQLVAKYVAEQNPTIRSVIYNDLHKPIRTLITGVLNRYYSTYAKKESCSISDIVSDCEVFLIEKVIHKYKQESGRAFSFLGTYAKRYFYDRYVLKENLTDPMADDFDMPYVQSDTENYDHLKEQATSYVNSILKRKKLTKSERLVLNTVLNLLQQTDWDVYYSTYFILKGSGVSPRVVYNNLKKHGLSGLIVVHWTLEKFNAIIGDEMDENKIRIILYEHKYF